MLSELSTSVTLSASSGDTASELHYPREKTRLGEEQRMQADGIITWRGINHYVRINWSYLIMDAQTLAENLREVETLQMAECISSNNIETAGIHRKAVCAIDKWLRDFQPITQSDCLYAPFDCRQELPPVSVTQQNQDSYIRELLIRCHDSHEDKTIEFVLNVDNATLVVNHRLNLVARYTASHIQSRTSCCGSIVDRWTFTPAHSESRKDFLLSLLLFLILTISVYFPKGDITNV